MGGGVLISSLLFCVPLLTIISIGLVFKKKIAYSTSVFLSSEHKKVKFRCQVEVAQKKYARECLVSVTKLELTVFRDIFDFKTITISF